MNNHTFKPGDMARLINCVTVPNAAGLYCIVESHPYEQMMRRPDLIDKTTHFISVVEITIGHPTLKRANINCLQYIPPDEWPESEYKQRELARVEGAQHGNQHSKPSVRCERDLETSK